jgi:ABC-type uncharacterized transport system substrate-binding protein
MTAKMKRREFITLLGGAAAWPLAARAQQPAVPVIGYFNSGTPEVFSGYLPALRQGLKESGYVESENVAIEYRWAENQPERLPELAADLVRRQVKVIAAMGAPASLAAGRATATIPIVFGVPEDPDRRVQIAHLATRYAVPAIASPRAYPEAGGLMSYGTSLSDAHHQAGVYAGRILKGAIIGDELGNGPGRYRWMRLQHKGLPVDRRNGRNVADEIEIELVRPPGTARQL